MAHRIMVVDDDEVILQMVDDALTGEGFEVVKCAAAAEAMGKFSAAAPDLALLDVMLPDRDGFSLCREMRGAKAGTPIIFLTVKGDAKSRLEGFHSGAQDYIQKPFSLQELCARVRVHLGIKKSRDELAARNYELELRDRARRDLTDMIVHDLKTPLSSIMGTISLIRDQGIITDQHFKGLMRISEIAAEGLLLMINDILDIGHAEQGGLPVEITEVDLRALFTKIRSLFEITCEKKVIKLSMTLDERIPTICSDAKLLFRILANLVSNAIKYSRSGSEVRVVCSSRDGAVRFAVSDRGMGVPEDLKEAVFQKYVRAEDARTLSGAGIGLAFCRLAAEALGGRIWYESREGGGSLFSLDLPLKMNAGAEENARSG